MIMLIPRTVEECKCLRAFAKRCGGKILLDIKRQPELTVDLLVSSSLADSEPGSTS
jgi:hypothetical protein